MWEGKQVISCLESNTWKHYHSKTRIRMQENAFRNIISEDKTIYGVPQDCKTWHNPTDDNKALPT